MRRHDGVAPSLSREDPATRATTKTGEGDSAPHEHAVAARPSPRPAGAAGHRLFERRARPLACHTSKQTHNKHHQKITLDAKESRKDPVQHGLVDRFTPSRDPPTKRRHQSEKHTPCTHRNTLGPPSET